MEVVVLLVGIYIFRRWLEVPFLLAGHLFKAIVWVIAITVGLAMGAGALFWGFLMWIASRHHSDPVLPAGSPPRDEWPPIHVHFDHPATPGMVETIRFDRSSSS